MKKFSQKIVVISFIIIFLIGLSFYAFFGVDYGEYFYTSQIEYGYYIANSSRYFAEFNFGQREAIFEYDGVPTTKVEYGIFKITLKEPNNYADNLSGKVNINDQVQTIILEKNPFDDSFMCDIEKIAIDETQILLCLDNLDDDYIEFVPKFKEWGIKYPKALKMGYTYLREFRDKNKNCFEGYLTIVRNNQIDDTQYFWCYRVINKTSDVKLVVFDVENGDIVLMS